MLTLTASGTIRISLGEQFIQPTIQLPSVPEALEFCNCSALRVEEFILEVSSFPSHFCCLFFETGSCSLAQAGLRFTILLSQLLSAVITVVGHHPFKNGF